MEIETSYFLNSDVQLFIVSDVTQCFEVKMAKTFERFIDFRFDLTSIGIIANTRER